MKPPVPASAGPGPAAAAVERLLSLMRRLRGPDGCPWDREQTLASLKPFLIEECYEALDAIDAGDPDPIREELGDVLLQIVFQSAICEESGWFGFSDVANTLSDKLVRRHPHVFGATRLTDAAEVIRNWTAIKSSESTRGQEPSAPRSAVDGIPRHLPALLRAEQAQTRASRAGFDWKEIGPVWQKIEEEVGELKEAVSSGKRDSIREELGDLLFTVVNLCRFLSLHAEESLQHTTEKFLRRFREVERRLQARGKRMDACSLEELDAVWDAVKAEEHPP